MSQTIDERMNEAQEDIEKAQAFVPYGKFNEGKNTFEIDTSIPLETNTYKDTIRKVYTGILNGEKAKVTLPKSVEMQILIALKRGKKNFTVTKTVPPENKLKTRYVVK